MHRELLRKYFTDVITYLYKEYICHSDVLFETFFVAFLKTSSGRQLIFDIVTSSVSGDFFGLNPQSSLMYDLAYIILDEFKTTCQ